MLDYCKFLPILVIFYQLSILEAAYHAFFVFPLGNNIGE